MTAHEGPCSCKNMEGTWAAGKETRAQGRKEGKKKAAPGLNANAESLPRDSVAVHTPLRPGQNMYQYPPNASAEPRQPARLWPRGWEVTAHAGVPGSAPHRAAKTLKHTGAGCVLPGPTFSLAQP